MARITLSVVHSDGKPMANSVLVMAQVEAGLTATAGAQVRPDGTFTIANQMIEFTPGGTLTILNNGTVVETLAASVQAPVAPAVGSKTSPTQNVVLTIARCSG